MFVLYTMTKKYRLSIFTRIPTFLGSTENVFELDQFYRYYGDDAIA
jgi:hypothetical protein